MKLPRATNNIEGEIMYRLVLALTFSLVISGVADAQLAITEVCTVATTACVAPGNKPAVRRGVTETIKIKGPFVDHTQLSGVTTGSSSVTVSRAQSCGSACLEVTVAVKSDHNLGMRLVPIFVKNVFGTTAFNAFIVRRGEITAMTQAPEDPATWGDTVRITITGNDIGDTRVSVPQSTITNHVEAPGSGVGTTSFTVRATGAQTSTSSGITVGDDAVAGISGNYRFTSARRTVNYRPVTAPACASTPGITAPSPNSPANGQVFNFTTNPVQAAITLVWGAVQGQFKAGEQFIVEIGPVNGALASSTMPPGVMQKNVLLARNTTFRWRVRALNCGLAAPFSPFSQFTIQ